MPIYLRARDSHEQIPRLHGARVEGYALNEDISRTLHLKGRHMSE